MNIQLFFENKEVELTEDIRFPLNKTYENLSNPTDIVVDYSKSIKIPITKKNNELFGNIFRLDKQILSSTGERNIGMYFDPARKIPFKLVYNQDVLIEGYAKFISASYSVDNKYYTVTLFSTLGDIFQKLNSIVVSRSQLTEEQKAEPDGGNKYILDDGIDNQLINADYVYHSFTSIDNDIRNTADIFGYNIIGFAPSYRGLYGNFNSNKIQTSSSTFQSLEDNITGYWNWYFQNQGDTEEVAKQKAEALKAGELIGDGLKDYQMREYRSYEMKPYIYFNQLMHMYERKCKEITGYDLVLDKYWFNANNPYWTKSCYMLDFLENKGSSKNNDIEVADKDSTYISYKDLPSSAEGECVIKKDNVVISPINGFVNFKAFKIRAHAENTYDKSYESGTIELDKETYVDIYFTIKDNAGGIVREKHFWYNEKGDSQEGYNPLEYVKVSKKVGGEGNTVSEDTSFLIPNFTLAVDAPLKGASIEIRVKFTNNRTYHNSNGIYYLLSVSEDPNGDVSASQMLVNPGTHEYEPYSNTSFRLYTDEIISTSDWKSNLYVKLANLYFRDEPLFNVILEYTKMFGLLWDIDYANKQVKIQTRYSYFKDIDLSKVPNWDDKVDRSKDYLIEPISFQDAYLKFNYNNIDGYRYKQYKDKYANNYGEKKLYTGYEFNGNTKDLFKDIDPSCVESKTFLTYLDIINWDINNSKLTPYIDDKVLASAESNDEKSSISIYNWYLRNDNVTLPYDYYITDDTDLQKTENSPCWISPAYLPELGLNTHSNSFPVFSPVYKANYYFYDDKGTNFGGLFNMPLEDYTFNGSIAKASGNYIYDLFWENYLNERYNYQNKKLTAYFRITPDEFLNFKFNKFIMLDNQLFMINKIIDYDITSPETCKCELIQVFDYKTYINGSKKFAPIATDVNSINIAPDRSYTIEVMSTPEIEYTLVPESTYVFPEDFESNDWIGYSAITITNELSNGGIYDGNLIIKTIDGQNTKVIPVHAVGNSITGEIIANPNSLSFNADGEQTVTFTSTPIIEGATIEYTGRVGQIRSSVVEEITATEARVTVQIEGFNGNPGTYTATLHATNREEIKDVPITITIPIPDIPISANPDSLRFGADGSQDITFTSRPIVTNVNVEAPDIPQGTNIGFINEGPISDTEYKATVVIDGFDGYEGQTFNACFIANNGKETLRVPISIIIPYKDIPIKPDVTPVSMTADGTAEVIYESRPVVEGVNIDYKGTVGKVEGKREFVDNTHAKVTYTFSGFNGHPGTYEGDLNVTNTKETNSIPFKVVIPEPVIPITSKPATLNFEADGNQDIVFTSKPIVTNVNVEAPDIPQGTNIGFINEGPISDMDYKATVVIDGFNEYYGQTFNATFTATNSEETLRVPITITIPKEPTPEKPTNLKKVKVSEFISAPVNNTDWYELTGRISMIENTTYGNLHIEDPTGGIYIYGLVKDFSVKNDKSFASIGLKVGDIITIGTLRSEYGGTPMGGGDIPAFYISKVVDAGGESGGSGEDLVPGAPD